MWYRVIISVLWSSIYAFTTADTLIETKVRACLSESFDFSKQHKNKNSLFSVFYGHVGLEVFNVLHPNEIKQIQVLVECVSQNTEFQSASTSSSSVAIEEKGLTYGSNTSYLTGVFQSALPHVYSKLIAAANSGFRRNRVEKDIEWYGVRSVQYLSFEREGMEAYKEELRLKTLEEKRAKESVFIVQSRESIEEHERQMEEYVGPDADDSVMHFLSSNTDTSYYMMLALDDRSSYVGGEILVRKTKSHSDTIGGKSVPAVDQEDDSTEDDEDDEDEQRLVEAEINNKMRKYNKLSRFTPDKSNLLLIEGGYDSGTREVMFGMRRMLLIEFWPYEDAEIGSTRPNVTADSKLKKKMSASVNKNKDEL